MNDLAERLIALSPQQRALLEKRLLDKRSRALQSRVIPRRKESDFCPLSLDQERLWFISQLEPESPVYNLASASRIRGRLDARILERSFNEVVRRHEILRTTFHAKDGRPYQRIAPALSLTIPIVDLSDLPETRREGVLQDLITEKSHRPFDLSKLPLMRPTLVQLGKMDYAIVTTLHHIITDRWSLDLFWFELVTLYRAFSDGKPSPLQDLPIQYADFAIWQREQLQGELAESRLLYWRKQLAGANFTLELPTDRPRPAVQTYRGKRQYWEPPAFLWEGLKTVCQKENATLFMTLLAAFYTLLYRYTKQEDIVVGSPYADRNMFETDGLIGYFLNMLILRADLSGDPTFRELLGRVRETTLGAYNNNDVPVVSLIQRFQPGRDLSRNPLFQVSYVLTNPKDATIKQSGMSLSPIEVATGMAKFDLTLGIRSSDADPLIIFEYKTDLFDDGSISRMMVHFQRLLEGIVAHPEQRINDLPMLTEAESRPRAAKTPPWRANGETNLLRTSGDQSKDMQKATIEGYWLSPQQQRLWKLRHNSSAAALHAQCAIRVNGGADPSALRRAVERVIRRHEALRTGFHSLPGMEAPIQVISEEARVAWREVDLRGMGEEERGRALAEVMWSERRLGSEIESGDGAVRASLAVIGKDEQVLVLSMSALVGDTRTLANLVGELCAGYAAEMGDCEDAGDATGEEIVQYADYTEWQNELVGEAGESAAEGREYWKRHGLTVELRLPLERRLEHEEEMAVAEEAEWEEIEIEDELRRGVERIGLEQGVNEEVALLACWQLLLWRMTRRPEIGVAVLCGGRKHEGLENALGAFSKYLPVVGHFQEGYSFAEVVRYVNNNWSQANEWQDYFSDGAIDRKCEDEESPFSALAFEYQSWPSSRSGSALSFSLLDIFSSSDLFKLRLCLAASTSFLRARFFFDSGRFSRAAIRLLASQFVSLLRSVVGSPRALIGDLEVLGEQERGLLLSQSERQSRPYPTGLPLELFEQWAARKPEEVAVECGDRRLSFAELNRLAGRVARRLREMGAGPDQRVALLLERSVGMVAAALGVWKAGAAYVPLDPSQPETRMIGMIKDSGAVATLSSRKVMGTVNLSLSGAPTLLMEDVEEMDVEEEAWREEEWRRRVRGEDLAYLIYTSGTTGQAKGVMIRHSSVANFIWALEETVYNGRELRRVSLNALMAFDASVKQLAQVCRGRTLVIIPEDVRQDPELLVNYLREKRIELFETTPSQLRALLEAGIEDVAKGAGVNGAGGSLQVVFVGGEAIDEALWTRLGGGKIACYNAYGPTECTINVTCERIRDERPYLGSAALGNMEVYILDETQRPAPAGVVGELCVGGAGVARGYNGDASRTAEKFVPDWLSGREGARLYRTGDLARMREDGRIEYVGRRDGQVKIRGYRVELGEIEAALMSHDGVRQAVVVAREREDGEKRLVAYVVGSEVESVELRRALRERLPEYMWPGAIVTLDKMPLTRNGKIDRNALPDPGECGGLEEEESDGEQPQTLCHEILIGIWRQVLGVSRVGIDDNFFDLGGHSLLATQLMSRVRQTFRVEMPLRSLFESPTVASLSEKVDEAIRAKTGLLPPPVTPVGRDGELPLSFAQQRLWFLDQMEPGNAFYNGLTALRLMGNLNIKALERTLNEIVRRHEALRTRFPSVDGRPLQIIDEPTPMSLQVIDISGEPDAEQLAWRMANDEVRRAFDLSRGPLLRATLLRLGEEDHVVLFAIHHIVYDEWSRAVLAREVATLYESFCAGRPSPLPDLECQYADYAHWQRNWLQGEVLEARLDFWRRQLGGALPKLQLMTDRARPEAPTYLGAGYISTIPIDLSDELKTLCRSEGTTLFMTLLAAYNVLLYRDSGQEDILIGTSIAGRTCRETESLIGFFINMLALRTNLGGDPKFRDLLSQVREVALDAYAHQDLPFDKIVEELQPERQLSRTPILQAIFGMHNVPGNSLELPELRILPMEVESAASRFDLTLYISDETDGLKGIWRYSTDLFDESTIVRMANRFEALLRAIVEDPGARINDLDFLPESQQQRLALEDSAQAESGYKKFKTVKPKIISAMKK